MRTLCLLLLCSVVLFKATSQVGSLDSSFGNNGIQTTAQISFTSTVIQGEKILAAGSALARYRADGKLDSSFGKNGIVFTDFIHDNVNSNSIALQGEKILVAGTSHYASNYVFALARYTANGALDSSFGENGIVTTDLSEGGDFARAITLQGDKIIVAGNIGNIVLGTSFGLARYTADGILDASFGVNGIVKSDIGGYVYTIALQGDKILVGGVISVARFMADGRLDSSFGESGKADFPAHGMTLQVDKITVAGWTSLARLTIDGKLDSSFGVNGKTYIPFGDDNIKPYSMTLQGEKIIVGGFSYSADADFVLGRYTADGTLDASFGENGIVITNLGGNDIMGDIAVQDNRLYAVGSSSTTDGGTYGAVAAYKLETPEPDINISIADVTVPESKKLAVVTVHLSAPATKWVKVYYTTLDKTAMSPQDYLRVTGTLLFKPGTTKAKVYIPIVNDSQMEATERFRVLLTKARNATIKDSIGLVTIVDDDVCAITAKQESTSLLINVSPNPSVNAFTVQLLGTNLKEQVTIRVYDVSGRLLEAREHISIGQTLHLGEQYKAGTYIIEAVQGSRSVQTKVIKTGQ